METADIRAEVERLSPWYYAFDLRGVRTDATPPNDHHGHRRVRLPDRAQLFLAGKTVLDAGCNEGGYTFSALDCGAASVESFDVREINIEKARFVARVHERENVRFQVASVDEWLREHPDQEYDYVFLCGLLYHLSEPWRTIEEYARRAREGVFVTCVLEGGEDGYSPFYEEENIAANEIPGEVSYMPRTTRTLIREFAKHGFRPRYVGESRSDEFWGGCSLLLHRCADSGIRAVADESSDRVEVHVVTLGREGAALELEVVVYNWSEAPLDLTGTLHVRDANGNELGVEGPQAIRLSPRASSAQGPPSESQSFPLRLELPDEASALRFVVVDQSSDAVVAATSLELAPR